MTIQINITFLIILIVVINEVLTHLFNWWVRRLNNSYFNEAEGYLSIMLYLAKTVWLICGLTSLVDAK